MDWISMTDSVDSDRDSDRDIFAMPLAMSLGNDGNNDPALALANFFGLRHAEQARAAAAEYYAGLQLLPRAVICHLCLLASLRFCCCLQVFMVRMDSMDKCDMPRGWSCSLSLPREVLPIMTAAPLGMRALSHPLLSDGPRLEVPQIRFGAHSPEGCAACAVLVCLWPMRSQ